MSSFKKATRSQAKARIALMGTAGSGKTYTALRLAHVLAQGGKVAVFDTERGSASKYADDENPDGGLFTFDVIDDMKDFAPQQYMQAIVEAEKAGYSVLVFDSLSHAWAGPGGVLEFVDARTQAGKSQFSNGWKDGTPLQNQMIERILTAKLHIIATLRTKTEYVVEVVNGKSQPRKVGMQPVQRQGLEYEFDVILDMDDGVATVGKTRCKALKDKRYVNPGKDLGDALVAWLSTGGPEVERAPMQETAPAEAPHDPSWEQARKSFCTTVSRAGFKYDDVALFAETKSQTKKRPSSMTVDERSRLLQFVISENGMAAVKRFIEEVQGG